MADGILLKAKYPRLYLNSKQKKQYILQIGDSSKGKWEWCLQWKRLLFETEISMWANFLEEIQAINVNLQQSDKWVWTNDTSGKYTVRSAYKLMDRNSKDDNTNRIFHAIWKLKIPNKVTLFVWGLIRDRLPTKLN